MQEDEEALWKRIQVEYTEGSWNSVVMLMHDGCCKEEEERLEAREDSIGSNRYRIGDGGAQLRVLVTSFM